MSNTEVVVVDYGMGNIWSVLNALRYLGARAILSGDPEQVGKADLVVLPGVGSFRKAMETLLRSGLEQAICDTVKKRGAKILGICLGMQLLGAHGTEDGQTCGLGLIPNTVDKFTPAEVGVNKIPHVGFNTVRFSEQAGLFRNLPESADFYFVHSYRMLSDCLTARLGTCSYWSDFLADFEAGNVCGTQLHPEKSQTNGLILLKNFIGI